MTILKAIESLFWLAQIWIAACLIKPKYFFESNVKVLNWLLKKQGFDTQLPFADRAFKVWKRDLAILLILNFIVIILIHLI
jgi:hypothetical protein